MLVDSSVKAQVHGDGGAKISELIRYIQGVVIDLDGGSLTDILCTDNGLFDADGEAKVFAWLIEAVNKSLSSILERGGYRNATIVVIFKKGPELVEFVKVHTTYLRKAL